MNCSALSLVSSASVQVRRGGSKGDDSSGGNKVVGLNAYAELPSGGDQREGRGGAGGWKANQINGKRQRNCSSPPTLRVVDNRNTPRANFRDLKLNLNLRHCSFYKFL